MTVTSPAQAQTIPGWERSTLGAISDDRIDQTAPVATAEFSYIDISSVDNRAKFFVDPRTVPGNEAPSRARQHVAAGDVLVSMTRPNLNAVARVPPELDGAIASTGFHVLRPRNATTGWLYYLVQSPGFVDSMTAKVQGALYPAVRPKDIRSFEVELPPIDERRRIVAALDATLGRLDAARARLRHVPEILKHYRASLLKAACEGRLVPTEAELARDEGRDYERADALLSRILVERRAKWEEAELAKFAKGGKPPPANRRAKYKEPAPPDASDLSELPEGWCWTHLSALVREPLRNGHSAKTAAGPHGVRTLTLTAVTAGDFSEANTKLTDANPEQVSGLWLTRGDLLFERGNTPELVGTASLYRGAEAFAIFPDLLIRARVSLRLSESFVELAARSDLARRYFQRSAQGTAGNMPKVDQTAIGALPVPIPPLAEQRRIVAAVERQLAAVERIEAIAAANLQRCEQMREMVLAKAFRGELVPQSTGEPSKC